MSNRADWRTILAAGAMLAVLAGSYEAARQVAVSQAARRARLQQRLAHAARADSVAAVAARAAVAAATPPLTPPDTASGCHAGPLRFAGGTPASRRPWQVRRYVGTVGGRPATVLLRWQHPDSVWGSFYYHRVGTDYVLQPAAGSRPGRPVLAANPQSADYGGPDRWYLAGRPGAVLRGTWHDTTGNHPFALRERYAGAVRLTIETTYLTGGWSTAWEPGYAGCPHVPTVSHEFLHLPGGLAGVPPALGPHLSPGLAARRRATRLRRATDARLTIGVAVRLNDFGLLSYDTTTEYDPFDGHSYYETVGSPLLDLVGGRAWPLDSLLQPGYWPPVRRLAAWHLRHDARFRYVQWQWQQASPTATRDTTYSYEAWKQPRLAPRPAAWVLTGAGLELTYAYATLEALNAAGNDTVLVSYTELRPLVRPGTPLARMLAARGLW